MATPTAVSESSLSDGENTLQAEPNPAITVWVNETSRNHDAMLGEMANNFSAQHNIDVEMVLVSPQLLPDLVNTAVLSGTLPDIIIHPIEFSVGWAERGVFDDDATADVLAQLGPETFNPDALNLVQTSSGQPSGLAQQRLSSANHLPQRLV